MALVGGAPQRFCPASGDFFDRAPSTGSADLFTIRCESAAKQGIVPTGPRLEKAAVQDPADR